METETMTRSNFRTTPVLSALSVVPVFLLGLLLAGAPAVAEVDSYRTPSKPLHDLATAPPSPWVYVTPDRESLLVFEWNLLKRLEELARPELGLAGEKISPTTRGPSRQTPFTGVSIQSIAHGVVRSVTGLPEDAALTRLGWAPGGRHVAMLHTRTDGIELWVLDLETAEARRLAGGTPETELVQTHDVRPQWLDAETVVVTLVPEDQEPPPTAPRVASAPVAQETTGEESATRTYTNLLENAHDEALFEHYFTGQMAFVSLDGTIRRVGDPAIYWDFEPSPDGRFLLVKTLHPPWSYQERIERFPRRVEIWNRAGEVVETLMDRPLQDAIPNAFGSVAKGPRDFQWRDDADATLLWAVAQDEGDAREEAEIRDRLYQQEVPREGEPKVLLDLPLRLGGVIAGDGERMIVTSWWWRTRHTQSWIVAPDAEDPSPVLVDDRPFRDAYADPGDPLLVRDERGRTVLLEIGDDFFLAGAGASPDGERPFLDRVVALGDEVETGVETRVETQRLFRSQPPHYERVETILDEDGELLLTRRESKDEPPNYFIRHLESGEIRRITSFPHPTPQLRGVQKELIHYQREDGVDLTATLYLPAGYDAERDGPLPTLFWAYPIDYQSAELASQVTGSPHTFDRVWPTNSLMWLAAGYAVLDDPKMPIVGGEGEEGEEVEPNDTFVEQLVSSAEAAVEEMVRRGVSERGRIAIGGHSYGAFMTANLLAHSDLFATGIARSGAYNRTLTPFGFQAEERTLWEAPELYFAMSPFMHADKVNEPLLMIHGREDENSGTYPLQSERMFEALKGHGAVARLVMLPHEGHGYRAEESILHMLWETETWMERYLSGDLRVETPGGDVEEAETPEASETQEDAGESGSGR